MIQDPNVKVTSSLGGLQHSSFPHPHPLTPSPPNRKAKDPPTNLCVLSGSPKGNESVTMQYVRFLELANPGHTFTTENIGQRIAAIEAHEEEFKKVLASRSFHPLHQPERKNRAAIPPSFGT
ncbi:MAG: hypothetical protein M0Q92_12520 [Methanoregula sp.]|nr:hypothetical protein [Methanoregula sp.]